MSTVGRRLRLGLVCLVAIFATAADGARARESASRQFILAQTPTDGGEENAVSIQEASDGGVLFLRAWPFRRPEYGPASSRTRLLHVRRDGSRRFVPPFGDSSSEPLFSGDLFRAHEVLALPDGWFLYADGGTIGRVRAGGPPLHVAGTDDTNGEQPSVVGDGAGAPATAVDLVRPSGLATQPDGSILFADWTRVRRVAPDGTITTVAGSDARGFDGDGDGGPAVEALLGGASDVLPAADGGLLIADTAAGRVRRVTSDGRISTIAGVRGDDARSSGDGGPATAARFDGPIALAWLADDALAVAERAKVRRIAPDGTISTVFESAEVVGERRGDFAGRVGGGVVDMTTTREGGLLIVLWAHRFDRIVYVAPPDTSRTLVALRGALTSERRVKVTIESTQPGIARLEVRRRGRVVARSARVVGRGRRTLEAPGRFEPTHHHVRVTLNGRDGAVATDHVRLMTRSGLPAAMVRSGFSDAERCRRMDSRRIDCAVHYDAEEGTCLENVAVRLAVSGALFSRRYGPACAGTVQPFERRPRRWSGPWSAWPEPR